MNRILPLIASPHVHWNVPGKEKNIYLTFDDGPVPGLTVEILTILRRFDIKATFFMVGDNIEKHPDVFHQVLDEGHKVGNHTYHHLNGWKTENEVYFADIKRCDELIPGRLLRPPYGRITRKQARILKKDYKIIMWSALTRDYDHRISAEQCLSRALKGTSPGAIVVFHDNEKARRNVLYALPRFIENGLKEGYGFRVLEETLF